MIKNHYSAILFILSLALLPFSQAHSAQLIIIIDDIGNNYALGNAMVELDAPLTLAFLPHTPYAKKLANKAYAQQKEIILHAPMENAVKAALGPGALTRDLSEIEFKQTLKKAIASIPHVQGINNHMGSLLTEDKQSMQWVMETLKDEQLYFIDSLTSAKSLAYQQALKHQIPALRRHIFLDNDKSPAALKTHTYLTSLNGALCAIRVMFSLLWRVPFSCHSSPSRSRSRTSSAFGLKPKRGSKFHTVRSLFVL